MFSEYASRFLAQSQSRVGFGQEEERPRNPLQRQGRQDQRSSRHQSTRSYLQRPSLGNPYNAAGSFAQFPFASRTAAANAPLFHSATEQFREDDDEEEHEREVADYYALQRSRRQFGGSRLEESSDAEDDGDQRSWDGEGDSRTSDVRGVGRGTMSKSLRENDRNSNKPARSPHSRAPLSHTNSADSLQSKGKMVDVGLESVTQNLTNDDDPPDDLAVEVQPDEEPPPMQQFRNPPSAKMTVLSPFLPQETSTNERRGRSFPSESDVSSPPPMVSYPVMEPPRHDPFWSSLFLLSLAALFASFLLVFLHTTKPVSKRPLGDTIYTVLQSSYYLLAVDTVIAVFIALLWLAVLRFYVRPLIYAILGAVPLVLFFLFLYPLISSYQGKYHGASIQDKAMRAFAFLPFVLIMLWSWSCYTGRHSLAKAIQALELSTRVLHANPPLIFVSFAMLASVITWTWVWTAMFTRVFLGGHLSEFTLGTGSTSVVFLVDLSSWWLGAYFSFLYLWTLGVLEGIQRAATAAVVSQWYFHRNDVPQPSSQAIMRAAIGHALTTSFGTVCLSALLIQSVRLPYLILPRRLVALATLCCGTIVPTSIATISDPLTLTHAAIHSQSLHTSTRAQCHRGPRFNAREATHIAHKKSHHLAVLLLRATRFITALAMGFGGWVSAARSLSIKAAEGGGTVKGSLYAYVVGLLAAAIAWGVLGSIDGTVEGIVDALLVCWSSDPEGRYCREAAGVFGDEQAPGMDEERRGFLRGDGMVTQVLGVMDVF